MCALTQSQDTRIRNRPALSEVVLLSLGTGTSMVYIEGKRLDWGFGQWAKPLVSLIMDGVSGIADYQCQMLLGNNYHRLAPVFPPGLSLPLDAIKRVPDMVQFAKDVNLSATTRWMNTYWMSD
jgi:hypothetical protein